MATSCSFLGSNPEHGACRALHPNPKVGKHAECACNGLYNLSRSRCPGMCFTLLCMWGNSAEALGLYVCEAGLIVI